MKTTFRKHSAILSIICALFLTVSSVVPGILQDACQVSYAADANAAQAGTESLNTTQASPVVFEDDDYEDMIYIEYPFLDTMRSAYEWKFPYSDEFFRHPSDHFSLNMARSSAGLCLSTFRSSPDVVKRQYRKFLARAGFTKLYAYGYDQPTEQNSLSFVIGARKIDDFTVIAVSSCGQGYGNEWMGNLDVGAGDTHEGFDIASEFLREQIDKYISKNHIEGKKKLWIAGISRAGAVGNVTASYYSENGTFDEIYAYLFGVPRVTKHPVQYPGIYNICGQFDPVPSIPLQSWGFERNGTDLYTPSQEASDNYEDLALSAGQVCVDITGKPFRNNPELNRQIRLILQFLGDMFPTNELYAERFQGILIDTWKDPSGNNIGNILAEAMTRLDAIDYNEGRQRLIFIDYISYIVAEHMRARQAQVESGGWAPEEVLEANVVLEHRPLTYVCWMFADESPENLFMGCHATRSLTFIGDINDITISVFDGDDFLGTVDRRGTHKLPGADPDISSVSSGPYMQKKGNQIIISLPADREYRVQVEASAAADLTYYDQQISPEELRSGTGYMYAGRMTAGTASMLVTPGERLKELTDETGTFLRMTSSDFELSPAAGMATELEATRYRYLTVMTALQIVFYLLLAMLILLLVCALLFIIHRHRVKKGRDPYSDWFVIVPHLICIVTFAVLTQLLTYFLFSIGKARAVSATVTIVFIFLLSIRALIREKTRRCAITSAVLLALVPLTYMYYTKLPINAFSYVNMVIYFVIIIALTTEVVLNFRPFNNAPLPEAAADQSIQP